MILLNCYINNGHSVDIIMIDFSKAFDSILHNKLIYKLKTFGICGKILLWIKEFLNNKNFAVKFNNYKSKSLPVISSVANNIIQNFKFAKVKMYADDYFNCLCCSK